MDQTASSQVASSQAAHRPKVQSETAVAAVVDARYPVAADNSDLIVDVPSHVAHPQIEFTVEATHSRSALGRFFDMKKFGIFIEIWVVVVTQMYGSSEKQKNISLVLLAAIMTVYAMEHWVMTRKVIIFRIALNFAKLLCFYLLPCILKPEWFNWYGFIIVWIIATANTCSDELKTMFTWCYEKGVLVIKNVIDKVSKPLKDQASLASHPSARRASS